MPPDDELFESEDEIQLIMEDIGVDREGARYLRAGGWV